MKTEWTTQEDNYYMIRFRHKYKSFLSRLSSILRLGPPNKSGELPVKFAERRRIFDLMYIQNDCLRSSKKYNLFKESVNIKRKNPSNRDDMGRFIHKIAV